MALEQLDKENADEKQNSSMQVRKGFGKVRDYLQRFA